jgi:hypothetical protein
MIMKCSVMDGPPWTENDVPGGKIAQAKGCSCPVQNELPKFVYFDTDCMVHEVELVPKH